MSEKDGRKGTSVIDIPQRTQKTQSWEEVNYLQTTKPPLQEEGDKAGTIHLLQRKGQYQYCPPLPQNTQDCAVTTLLIVSS